MAITSYRAWFGGGGGAPGAELYRGPVGHGVAWCPARDVMLLLVILALQVVRGPLPARDKQQTTSRYHG